ncbi:MAG: T9SS type A sorting domain-containing protein [Bacteroidetes bacterium]|nr:T9SS type A sorting domain-containing protein [Bacteroidota bacterium]
MKKLFLTLITALAVVSISTAQTFTDDFTGLTTGATLIGQSSWTKGGTGPEPTVQITSPLTYPGYNGGDMEYVEMPTPTATASRAYKGFTPITTFSTHTVMYSALIRINTAAGTSSNYFMTVGNSGTGTTYFARLFAIPSGSGFKFGLSKLSNTPVLEGTERVFGETYLVVVRYTFHNGATNDDEAFVWVNPSGTSEPATETAAISILTAAAASDPVPSDIGNITWHSRGVNNPTGAFDALRVGFGATSADAWTNLNPGTLPVELSSFSVSPVHGGALLKWETASEVNNAGFEILKNGEPVAFINGKGNTTEKQSYQWMDKAVSGQVTYQLRQTDTDGKMTLSEILTFTGAAGTFEVEGNYPNPFNPETKIRFNLAADSQVLVKVSNIIGQEIAVLANEKMTAGKKEIRFNAANLASGVYFYSVTANGKTITRSMTLMK